MKYLLLWIGFAVVLWGVDLVIPVSFSADFTQTITNPDKKAITYRGQVYFSDTNQLKWIYTEPTHKEVCSNGIQVTVVDHDLEQISYYLIEQGFDLVEILRRAKPSHKHKGIYIASYQKVHYALRVDKEGRVIAVGYSDTLENRVEFYFAKMHYNQKSLKNEEMQCSMPQSYDTIEE